MNKPNGGAAFPSAALAEHAKINRQGMSLREYAAITLRVPTSGINWLDDMIRERRREDLAATTLQALITREREDDDIWVEHSAVDVTGQYMLFAAGAYLYADAMLATAAGENSDEKFEAAMFAEVNEPEQLVPLAHLQRLVDTMVAEVLPLHHGREFPALTSAQAFLAGLPQQAE